ncbi:acyl-CoA dehydrogenase [Marinobacter sediminum]|uniref:acyl-CoA dehydrogenase family protein n=1 Tax=Marinobacter sediminum TaxID=256323 RepID=UPI00203051FC|nr:acyl-CoA dehydrogenase family protein [Marinobacter sediminum]MCM0612404.1 acyl-CoA dehydrogenase [Marinobacter sediminum]
MKLLDLTQDFRGLAGDLLPDNVRFGEIFGKGALKQVPPGQVKHIPLNPRIETYENLDARSRTLVKKTIDFFEKRGKQQLKEDDHNRTWYQDFLDFQAKEKLFATFLTPSGYGAKDARWDTYRNCALNEVLGFYGLAYWYTWQVSILGLGPIWISDNEAVKKRAAKMLKEGGIFAFGLSEKEHGADIYATDMILSPQEDGSFRANGGKYYIGNGNQAALVSVFGRREDTNEYVFFVVESQHKNYELVKNVVSSQNYVAEFRLNDYPVREEDILATGQDAWDMALNTINIGKFNLGWASIGIATHAYYEAINHASHRWLFDHYVTDFVHIKQLFTEAYTRLTAMKLFAQRATDYVRVASPEDRRYLLFTPMVKMKVTTQGEEVINELWDVIAAKGFEKNMYFETAVKDIRALPKLEGTVHVNMALILKFMPNYFFKPGEFEEVAPQTEPRNDDFLFNQGATRGLGKTRFHDYQRIYDQFDLPNVNRLKKQIRLLKLLLMTAKPNEEQQKDFDFLLNLGELFTLVVYGQLILENAHIQQLDNALVDQIFDVFVRDFSKYALELAQKPSATVLQQKITRRMIQRPAVDHDRQQHVWENYAYAQRDQYEMKD